MKTMIMNLIAAFSLMACSPENIPVTDPEKPVVENPSENKPDAPDSPSTKGSTIVVYFSCTNTTRGIVEKIAGALGCDTWRITPEEPYTSADLDYNNNSSRANREQNDPSARPRISVTIDLSQYEVVYVGYPIWWGKLPKILWTFLDAYDLSGKTVIPFCTSGSSGIATSVSEIRSLEPAATVLDGRRFESNASQQAVSDWVQTVQPQTNNTQNMTMNITIDEQTMSATLAENSSTAALIERLQQGHVTYSAHDYGGFEKVGDLGFTLPQNNRQVTTSPGDIILYQGTSLCLYYAQNSWNFTPMGKINYTSETELRNFLKAGKGNITVTLSLPETTGISSANASSKANGKAYKLNGTLAKADAKGIVIQNGKKTLRK